MPQLDIYIIHDMLFSTIIIFILVYIINISNNLVIINLILRVRKLKICLDQKYIYMLLKESLKKVRLKFYEYTFKLYFYKFKFIKKYFINDDILDISNLKKNILKRKSKI